MEKTGYKPCFRRRWEAFGARAWGAFPQQLAARQDPPPAQILLVRAITKKVTKITHFYGASFCCSTLAYYAKALLIKCKCPLDNLLKDTNLQLITAHYHSHSWAVS